MRPGKKKNRKENEVSSARGKLPLQLERTPPSLVRKHGESSSDNTLAFEKNCQNVEGCIASVREKIR